MRVVRLVGVWNHRGVEAGRECEHLTRLGDSAHAVDVRLHDVHGARREHLEVSPARELVFASGDGGRHGATDARVPGQVAFRSSTFDRQLGSLRFALPAYEESYEHVLDAFARCITRKSEPPGDSS